MLFSWKLPFCYYLSKGTVKGEILEKIIANIIMKLHQINLSPCVIVADQGPNNRNAFKRLGATKENPVVMINEKEIFLMFDTPHLLKSLRNNLMNKKVDIIDDKRSSMGRSMVKITHKHVNPNAFEKMKVRYAVQVFSNSVCAAIMTAVATNELNSRTAIHTAQCFKKINNIFDCLNSRSLKDSNPYRQGLSIYNKLPYTTLVEYFKRIQVFEGENEKKNIYCIEGFQWTIKAVLILWDNLQKEGVKYFLTSCLNQDPLENLFSVIMNWGGYNPQPTAREFRIALQHNMHIRLQNSDCSNCEVDNDELLDVTDLNTDCNEDSNNIEDTFQSLDSSQEHVEQCSQPLDMPDSIFFFHHTTEIQVIQDTSNGPILFNIYINDMSETQSSGNCMMSPYADDSSFLIQAKDLETAIKTVDGVFKNVENWITKEKMIINKSKTNIIFFKTNRSNITLPDRVHISDVNIVPNSSARLLGMIIDENLSWNKHICQLCNRLSSVLYSLKMLSRYMTKQMLKIVYHSNFESLVRYGCIFYGNNANMETVLILQKQALRVINNLGFRDNCRGVFKKTGILTIYGIYIQKCVLFVFKNREYFATQITDHPYETRNIDYVYPKHRLTLTEKNVYYSCITIYNKTYRCLVLLGMAFFQLLGYMYVYKEWHTISVGDVASIMSIYIQIFNIQATVTCLVLNMDKLHIIIRQLKTGLMKPKVKRHVMIAERLKKFGNFVRKYYYGSCSFVILVQPVVMYLKKDKELFFMSYVPPIMGHWGVFYFQGIIRFFVGYSSCTSVSLNIEILKDILSESDNIDVIFECVKRHEQIVRLLENVQHIIHFGMSTHFCIGVLVFGTTLFTVLEMEVDLSQSIFLVPYSIAIILIIYVHCWFGNDIIYRSADLTNAIFSSKWIGSNLPTQKTLIIFMAFTNKPLSIHLVSGLFTMTTRHVINHLEHYCNENNVLLSLLPPGVKNKVLRACTVTPVYLNKGRVNLKHVLPLLLNSQTVAVDLTAINVDDDILRVLALSKNIRKLHLEPEENTISTEGLLNLFKSLHKLNDLSLRHSYAVNDSVLECLANNCPKLTLLDFDGCRNITDVGIQSISRLQNITCLTLSYSQVSDKGISYLVNSSNATTIKELQINNCGNITEDGLKLITNCCPKIEILMHRPQNRK
nr:unnamed protein product [Callosobruchus chinensis]